MNLENNALTDFRGIKIKGRVPMSYPARRQLEERQETTKEHFAFRVSKYISANAKEAFYRKIRLILLITDLLTFRQKEYVPYFTIY